MTPALVVTAGPAAGLRVDVERRLVVGRQEGDVAVQDPEMSRRHATVEPIPDASGLVVADLGSTNGTWVNGTRIGSPTAIRPGDEVAMGDTRMRVEVARQGEAPPQARPAAAPPPLPVGAAPPQQPFGAFAPGPVRAPVAPRRAATRLPVGIVVTWVVVTLDAIALLVYFAAR